MELNKHMLVLNNEMILITALLKWREQPEKSLRTIFKRCYEDCYPDKKVSNSRELLNKTIDNTLTSLSMQTFTCTYEFLRNNIDDKMTTKLKNMRNKLSRNSSNLNTAKFLDTIRQAFAHNDLNMEVPNWNLNQDNEIEINFKGQNFIFKFDELRLLMNEFLLLKKEHSSTTLDILARGLDKAVRTNTLTPSNVNHYVVNTVNGRAVKNLDSYQANALYNLICPGGNIDVDMNVDRLKYLLKDDNFGLINFLPFKQHSGMLAFKNNLCFRMLLCLKLAIEDRKLFELTAINFEKRQHLIDGNDFDDSTHRAKMVDFMANKTALMEVYLTSNAIFNVFSLYSADSLEKYLNHFDIDVRRLRNSIIHGRFYFNFDDSFEFYDGRDKNSLEHVGTLSLSQICDIIADVISDNAQQNTTHSI